MRYLYLSAILFITGCSTVSVNTDYDRNANFARYDTYAWAPQKQQASPSVDNAIRSSVNRTLPMKGLTRSGRPDLYVAYHVTTKEKVNVNRYTDWNFGPRYGLYGYNYGMWSNFPQTYTSVSQYTQGTLLIDFIDAKTRKLVWRGTGTAVVGSTKANVRNVEKAVEKMLAEYPPGR